MFNHLCPCVSIEPESPSAHIKQSCFRVPEKNTPVFFPWCSADIHLHVDKQVFWQMCVPPSGRGSDHRDQRRQHSRHDSCPRHRAHQGGGQAGQAAAEEGNRTGARIRWVFWTHILVCKCLHVYLISCSMLYFLFIFYSASLFLTILRKFFKFYSKD